MNKVTVNAFDQNNIVISGSVAYIVSTSARFNGFFRTAGADQSQFKFVRYFGKSGTYRMRILYLKDTNAGLLDMGINKLGSTTNTTNLINQLDTYNGSATYNNIYETTISVARGINEINFKANGKNVSSSNYYIYFSLVEFDLIDEHPVLGEDGIAQINQGSMVLLARHKAELAESTKTINLADILDSKYSQVQVIINGEMTASAALQMVLNGLGTNYLQKGQRSVGGTVTAINITTGSVLSIASTTVLTGATTFYSVVTIQKDETGIWSGGRTSTQGFSVGLEETGWNHDAATATKLTTLTFSTSTSTWKAGTTIEIYGVKKS